MRPTSAARATGIGLATLLAVCALVGSARVLADAAPTEPPFPYVPVRAACVEILVEDHLWGSGWIATPEGLVLTAAHCVRKPGRVEVLWEKRRILAKRVAVDLGNDLALLRLPPRAEPYPALDLAASTPPPAARVWLVGTPIYRHAVLLGGTMAGKDPTYEWYGNLGRYIRVMHVTATTPPGVSGGPWLDERGAVVALHSGTMTRKDVPVGVGFVVPRDALAAFLEHGADAATPTLGAPFEEVWEQARSVLDRYPPRTEGVVVVGPLPGGPLAKAGVEKWQVITAVDGRPVRYRDDLISYVRTCDVGDTVALSLLLPDRKGRKVVEVALEEL